MRIHLKNPPQLQELLANFDKKFANFKHYSLPIFNATDSFQQQTITSILKSSDETVDQSVNRLPRNCEDSAPEVIERKDEWLRREILYSAPVSVISINQEGIILDWTDQTRELFGWSFAEARGRFLTSLLFPADSAPADAPTVNQILNNFIKGGKNTLETIARHKNGSKIPIEICCSNVQKGALNIYCLNIRDISKRKNAEYELEKSRMLMERAQAMAHVGHWEMDLQDGLFTWSDEMFRIHGLQPSTQRFSAAQWLSWIVPEDRQRVHDSIKQQIHVLQSATYEFRIQRENGEIRYIRSEGKIEKDVSGKIASIYGILHDITDNYNLQQQLQQRERQEQLLLSEAALAAEERERNFLGRELHDNVNQLLAASKVGISALSEQCAEKSDLFGMVDSSIQKAIDEIRKISHRLVTPDFDEITLVERLECLLWQMFRPLNINSVLDVDLFQETKLSSLHKLNIYRIAQEQCNNIVKYAKAKNVVIKLETSDEVRIMLSDNGEGAASTTELPGIGLRNIKNRVQSLGGDFTIESAPGAGFSIQIRFPLITTQYTIEELKPTG